MTPVNKSQIEFIDPQLRQGMFRCFYLEVDTRCRYGMLFTKSNNPFDKFCIGNNTRVF